MQRLAQIKMPTVLINQHAEPPTERLYSVEVDDYAGASQVMAHLWAWGTGRSVI